MVNQATGRRPSPRSGKSSTRQAAALGDSDLVTLAVPDEVKEVGDLIVILHCEWKLIYKSDFFSRSFSIRLAGGGVGSSGEIEIDGKYVLVPSLTVGGTSMVVTGKQIRVHFKGQRGRSGIFDIKEVKLY